MSVTDDIKQRLSIVDLIAEGGVQLRKAGRNFTGFCPFHTNTRTPAFYVFPASESYYCFGCHATGDVFGWVMAREGIGFGDALRKLASRAGVQLEERTPEQDQEDALEARLRQINADAAIYWNHVLTRTERGADGRGYLERRGLVAQTVEAWQLGYAPEDWSDLLRYLTDRKNYTPEELESAGLVIKREGGGYYDRFRNRLMFPIRDARGHIVGFGGRALGDDHAKYMNTPETPLFHKSNILYGIDLARDAIRRADGVVLVEGYIDVLTAHQAGFANVVAPMGTALTREQVGVVRKLTRNVWLALDADAAGANATLKGLETLRNNMDSTVVPVPTPQGYIRWERELDGTIRIIDLPAGRDPDDVIRESPDTWRALVDGARPLMDYYFGALTASLDLEQGRAKREAVERLAPLVGALVNPVEREHYTLQLARLVSLGEGVIRNAVAQIRRGRAVELPRVEEALVSEAGPTREDELLSLLLRFPNVKSAVESELQRELTAFPEIAGDILGSIDEPLMHVENKQLWRSWQRGVSATADTPAWLDTLDPYLKGRAQRLLTHEDTPALPVIGRQHHATELAVKIAGELRRGVVINRKNQLKAIYESMDDGDERRTIEARVITLNRYQTVVTAPRRSPVYRDLRDRVDQFK